MQQESQIQPQPNTDKKYGDAAYWEQRYSQQQGRYEWLEDWSSLRKYLLQDLRKYQLPCILNVGCGTSNIQQHIPEEAYTVITCIDISQILIAKCQSTAKIRYQVMDARSMKFSDSTFELLLDKSTLDSLLCADSTHSRRYINEAFRVLKDGGTLFVVSYGHPQQRLHLFHRFNVTYEILNENHFLFRCVKPREEEHKEQEEDIMEM